MQRESPLKYGFRIKTFRSVQSSNARGAVGEGHKTGKIAPLTRSKEILFTTVGGLHLYVNNIFLSASTLVLILKN